ncbi:MAG: hypothetical protein J3R72DRAFT_175232 [Linnemannia gamsii]|nr:MAG: hypothetical protein J3R72DRAFT_175232 [Linnemannia gamsii]
MTQGKVVLSTVTLLGHFDGGKKVEEELFGRACFIWAYFYYGSGVMWRFNSAAFRFFFFLLSLCGLLYYLQSTPRMTTH